MAGFSSRSYIFAVLELLAERRVAGPIQTQELYALLENRQDSVGFYRGTLVSSMRVEELLNELADLGIVSRSEAGWSCPPMQKADESAKFGDNLVPPPPSPPFGDDDEGDQPGQGLREVVAHPILFALSKEDLDRLLDEMVALDG